MRDIKVYVEDEVSKIEEGEFGFTVSNWNDYSYRITYNVIYKTNQGIENLGEVKFFCNSEEELGQVIQNPNSDIYMIGVGVDFYLNLFDKVENKSKIKLFLERYNDVTIIKGKIESLRNKVKSDKLDKFENAFLRSDSVERQDKLYELSISCGEDNLWFIWLKKPSISILINALYNDKKLLEFYINYLAYNLYMYKWQSDICDEILNFYKKIIDGGSNSKNDIEDLISTIDKMFKDNPDNPDWVEKVGHYKQTNEILRSAREIEKLLKVDINDLKGESLAQYTSLSSVPYLISKEDKTSLRFTNANQLNDPLEGKAFLEYFGLEASEEYSVSTKYISSATTEIDKLPLWKQYADDAKGVCLVYSENFFKDFETNIYPYYDSGIYRVCYLDKCAQKIIISKLFVNEKIEDIAGKLEKNLEKIRNNLNQLKDLNKENDEQYKKENHRIVRFLASVGYLFKKTDYSYENEFRLILDLKGHPDLIECDLNDRVSNDIPFPFLRTNLVGKEEKKIIEPKYSTIYLGPKSQDIDYIAPYIKYCNSNISVRKSKIAYR